MEEHDILARIHDMVAEERTLRDQATGTGVTDDVKTRLTQLEQALDQCWDLLRQRRAASEFGGNPEAARVRPVDEVEEYLQ